MTHTNIEHVPFSPADLHLFKTVMSHSNVTSPKGKPHVFQMLFIQSPRSSIVLYSYRRASISNIYHSIPLVLYSINIKNSCFINPVFLLLKPSKTYPNNKNYPGMFVLGSFRLVKVIFHWTPVDNNLKQEGRSCLRVAPPGNKNKSFSCSK